jgi:hypothetical protein
MKRSDDNMTTIVATFEADVVHQTCIAEYNNCEFSIQSLGQQLIDNDNQTFGFQLLDACLVTAVLAIAVFGVFVCRWKR